jgi:hypothetical protein
MAVAGRRRRSGGRAGVGHRAGDRQQLPAGHRHRPAAVAAGAELHHPFRADVVYDVSGNGRAINITYVDTGGVLQTEFNVMLPWSKEVELPQPAKDSASVSIINVGREVRCSITINGVPVQQLSGAGLTICTAAG